MIATISKHPKMSRWTVIVAGIIGVVGACTYAGPRPGGL